MLHNPLAKDLVKDAKFTRYAHGLHEILGLAYRDGWEGSIKSGTVAARWCDLADELGRPIVVAVQEHQLGTGHAVQCALPALKAGVRSGSPPASRAMR